MDDQEQREIALAKLQQFRAAAAGEKDPIADEVARELEEQRRSKARNRLIGAGKVSSMCQQCRIISKHSSHSGPDHGRSHGSSQERCCSISGGHTICRI
jgi:hypothetical protein